MANIWDEFDKAIDTEGLAKDVEEAAENGGKFRMIPTRSQLQSWNLSRARRAILWLLAG